MALIFSPIAQDVLEGPYQPKPRCAFMMIQLGEGVSQLESEMDDVVTSVLTRRKLPPVRASSERGQKDYLDKIIQLIRGCGMGIAIFSEYTPAPTLANIFFEVALCNLLGKPVILVKSEGAKAPSDFVRTEWISYGDGKKAQLKRDFSRSITSVLEYAKYYENIGDIALVAEEADLELAYERYRQSFLIDGRTSVRRKLESLGKRARRDDDFAAHLKPARSRFRASISEFLGLLDRR